MADLTVDQKISKLKTILMYLGAYTSEVVQVCREKTGTDLLEYLRLRVIEVVQAF